MTSTRLIAAAFAAAAALSPAAASTVTFDFAGETSVQVFETAQTAAEFYGPRNTTNFDVGSNGANFFLHRDTRSDVFSFGIIVDGVNDGSGGRFAGSISGLTPGAFVALADDNASEFSLADATTAVFDFRFLSCCVDGAVISGLDPNNLALSISLTNVSAINDVVLIDPTGFNSLGVAPAAGQSIAVSSAPEPGTWSLFVCGFFAVGLAMKRQRQDVVLPRARAYALSRR
ncbi:MAG: hypothetical protein ACFB00_12055 [Parvularculaceae bacterium]